MMWNRIHARGCDQRPVRDVSLMKFLRLADLESGKKLC
jgi:hypothetical protein